MSLINKYMNKWVEIDNPNSNFNGDSGMVIHVDERHGWIDVKFEDGRVTGFRENEIVLAS